MAEPLTRTRLSPIVPIELLAEPERDRTEHDDADDFHGLSPACATWRGTEIGANMLQASGSNAALQ
jgi:hypothetical protein